MDCTKSLHRFSSSRICESESFDICGCGGMASTSCPLACSSATSSGVFFRPEAVDQKEIGLHPALIQNVQIPLYWHFPACGVKADGKHLFLCIDVIHRQLARRRRRHQPRAVASRHISGRQTASAKIMAQCLTESEPEALLFIRTPLITSKVYMWRALAFRTSLIRRSRPPVSSLIFLSKERFHISAAFACFKTI